VDDEAEDVPLTGQPMTPDELIDRTSLKNISSDSRIVSIEEAREELPLISRLLAGMQAVHDQAVSITGEIEELLRVLPIGHPHITEMTDFLGRIVHEWQDIGNQIQLLGACVSILDPGHVEWHGVVDGELVMYSWCQGEEDIEWWYPLGLSTTERRPLLEA
jgi:hypothetical protein